MYFDILLKSSNHSDNLIIYITDKYDNLIHSGSKGNPFQGVKNIFKEAQTGSFFQVLLRLLRVFGRELLDAVR